MHRAAYKILAAVLLFLLATPLVCPALLASDSGVMPGRCHGHHQPASHPGHSCCYSKPQAPSQLSIAASSSFLNIQSPEAAPVKIVTQSSAVGALAYIDTSPPIRFILRI